MYSLRNTVACVDIRRCRMLSARSLRNILRYIPLVLPRRKVVIGGTTICVACCRPSPARLSAGPFCVVAGLCHFISFFSRFSLPSHLWKMASTVGIPAYMSAGVAILQPPHLEGDAALATEILPGPPSLVSIQQSVLKRDPRKPSMAFSYLPPSDPGSTYSGIVHGTLIGHEPEASRMRPPK